MASVALFLGSARRERNGMLVATWIERKLVGRGHSVNLVDPLELGLPILDRTYEEMKDPPPKLRKLKEVVVMADAYVAVTSEYNHGVPAAIKNTLDYIESGYAHKPSAVISYSTGPLGGARVVESMRLIFAGLGAPTIPPSISLPNVTSAFGRDGELVDKKHDKAVDGFLNELEWHIDAFRNQRTKAP